MSQTNPWSIKGIKTNNRETAKEIAGKRGLTLGELVNRLIEEADTIYSDNNSHNNSNNPNSHNDFKAYAMPNNMSNPSSNNENSNFQNSRFENSRLAQAMEDLNRKLEAVNNNGIGNNAYAQPIQAAPVMHAPVMQQPVMPQAIPQYSAAIPQRDIHTERAIDGLLRRIEENELRSDRNGHNHTIALNEIKNAQETIKERLARIERDDPSHKSLSALRNLENAMERIAHQAKNAEIAALEVERKLNEERKHQLSPKDVEDLLNVGINSLKSSLDNGYKRLNNLENITTEAIEQTDKGISLLSERVRETENQAQQINEVLKDSLVDLSARLTDLESRDQEELKKEIAADFEKRLRNFELKYAELNRNINQIIDEKLAVNQNETVSAIENISDQLVSSNQVLGARLKKIEEFNQNNIDSTTSLRLELGKVSVLVNERLEQIEKRDSNLFENVSDHVNKLTQTINSRIANIEAQTSEIISQIEDRNKNFEEQIQNRSLNFTSEIDKRIAETEQRLNESFNGKYESFKQEIYSTEERFKNNNAPIRSGLELILDRLDDIENKANAKNIETLKAPDFTYTQAPAPSPILNEIRNEPKAEEAGIIPFAHNFEAVEEDVDLESFDEFEDDFELETPPTNQFIDEEEASEIEPIEEDIEFLNDFGKDFDELANLSPNDVSLNNFEEVEDEYNISNSEEWAESIEPTEAKPSKNDYLRNARAAANSAASESTNLLKSSAKKVKPVKEKIQRQAKQKVENTSKKLNVSPLVMTAAGALVFASAFGAYQILKPKTQINGIPTSQTAAPVTVPVIQAPQAEPVNEGNTNEISAEPAVTAPVSTPTIVSSPPTKTIEATPLPPKANTDGQTPNFQQAPVTKAPEKSVTKPVFTKTNFTNPLTKAYVTPSQRPIAKPIASNAMPRIASTSEVPKTVKATTSNTYNDAIAKINSGDVKTAFELMQRAASAGDVRAQNRLARMYERGEGVAANPTLARQWTQKAANSGSKNALHNLGTYYSEGNNSVQDLSRAADYYKKAAKKGNVDSQYNLGAMAELGMGVDKSPKDAYYWYSLAAKGGDSDAGAKAANLAKNLPAKDKEAIDKNIVGFKPEASID